LPPCAEARLTLTQTAAHGPDRLIDAAGLRLSLPRFEAAPPIGFPWTDDSNDDGSNIQSAGGRSLIQRLVGDDSEVQFEWEEFEHTNLVVARWLFQREVMRRFQGALGVAPTDARKFDARIGFGSRAHKQISRVAEDVVNAYIDNVFLKQKSVDEYAVGPALVRRDEMETFSNALHEGYSGLNESLELPFARAIDKTGLTWYRNPSRSGYNIPLISVGPTRNWLSRLPGLERQGRFRTRHHGRPSAQGEDRAQAAVDRAREGDKRPSDRPADLRGPMEPGR
jgi:hypothetical protein